VQGFGAADAHPDEGVGHAAPDALFLLLEEDQLAGAEKTAEIGVAFFQAQPAQPGAPFRLDLLAHLAGQVTASGAAAFRIAEDVKIGQREGVEQIEGFGKVAFGFAGKAGQDVGAQADIGHLYCGAADQLRELGRVMAAVHRLEDGVAAALGRDVEKPADVAVLHKAEEFFRHGGHFDRGDAQPLQPWKKRHGFQKINQAPLFLGPGADIDPGEDDLAVAGGDELPGFAHEVGKIAAAAAAAGEGNLA